MRAVAWSFAGEFLLFALGVSFMLMLMTLCTGCTRVQSGATVAAYGAELDRCIESGHDAGSMAVYEACAAVADRKFGRVKK